MKRLCVLPCGAKKIWDHVPDAAETYEAQWVYTGALHKKCQSYARAFFAGDWVILSAKHGLLRPGDPVTGNYNVAFGQNHPEEISPERLAAQALQKRLSQYEEIVVLGGRKFRRVMPHAFPEARHAYPLADYAGIGYMLQALDRAVDTQRELGS